MDFFENRLFRKDFYGKRQCFGQRLPLARDFAPFLKQNPKSRASIKRVMAEGDLVALHVHSQLSPEDAGEAVVDIFRFDKDGKIMEHWDVIQAVPKEKTASGRSMF